MKEVWRAIPGWEGFYEASNLGQIRSVNRYVHYVNRSNPVFYEGCVLKGWKTPGGYRRVSLTKNNRHYPRSVHRLVMLAFTGAQGSENDVRHLNGDPADNRLENLSYGSKSENRRDTIRHGRDRNLNKTHCPRGHEYGERNTYHGSNSRGEFRLCRECANERNRAYYAKHKAHILSQRKGRDSYLAMLEARKVARKGGVS